MVIDNDIYNRIIEFKAKMKSKKKWTGVTVMLTKEYGHRQIRSWGSCLWQK